MWPRPTGAIRIFAVAASLMLTTVAGPLRLWAADPSKPTSFELDVQPVLTAHGCNAGACHGKQRGQNGFQLSLLGFDADFDFNALARDARGRRLFPAAPQSSLLLRKATGELPHGGGRRLDSDSEAYRALLSWIDQGASRRTTDEPSLDLVTLEQTDFSLAPLQPQALRVAAHYSDGTTRDVTNLTTYLSNDDAVVSVDSSGTDEAQDRCRVKPRSWRGT